MSDRDSNGNAALLLYSSTDGQTRRIAERIKKRFDALEQPLQVLSVEDLDGESPANFHGAIVGAPVRYGKHDPRIIQFLERNADTLSAMPNAFFSVNLIARTPAKRSADGNSHVRKFLDKLKFKPWHVEVFAGKLDYPSYAWLDRFAIRMIMKMTGGPTGGTEVIDYTDWDQVDRFATNMANWFQERAQ